MIPTTASSLASRPERRTRLARTRHLLLPLVLLFVVPAPALIEVRQDGFGDATGISAGLALAAPGEEVRITDGATYNETNLTLGGNRTLTSVPVGATINGSGVILNILGNGETNRVEGLTIISDDRCIRIYAEDSSNPQVVNCNLQGTNTLVYGLYVLNSISSALTPATITLQDVTFNTMGRGIYHTTPIGGSNVSLLAATTYAATALDFSVIGGDAIYFDRPGSGTFAGILVDGLSNNVIRLDVGTRFSNVTFSSVVTSNVLGSMLRVDEDHLTVTLHDAGLSSGQYGIHVASMTLPQTARPTINLTGSSSITGVSENAILLEAPCVLNLGAATLTATGTTFPAGIALYAPDYASGMSVTANGTTFTDNGTSAVHAISGSVTADANSAWVFNDCNFIESGTREIVFDATSSTGNTLALNRCTLQEDKTRVAGGSPLVQLNSLPATLVNCVLDLNSNSGIAQTGTEALQLDHITLVAPGGAAVDGLFIGTSALLLRNSIIDVPSGGALTAPGGGTIVNSCFRGGITSNYLPLPAGSFVANPVFTTPSIGSGTGNFVLAGGSPCNGAGDPAVGVTTDRDGNARPNPIATNPEIGAYETVLVPVELSAFTLD
jgi:hypothetical protein